MTTQPLHAQISPRLLAELPRFFGGFESALAELFQNMYRAGATEVHAFYNPAEHSLTLMDNGAGLDDPQKLLTAGATGWDEARVIEPAGVGAFAILRDEFVARVEYESCGAGNWWMALTPAVLRGDAAQVTPGTAQGQRHGLTVRLLLRSPISITPDLLRRARGLYPFRVCFATDGGDGQELEPWREWAPDLTVATPLGDVEWTRHRYADGRARIDQAVWEYRALTALTLQHALQDAAYRHRHAALADRLVRNGCVRWFVHPASGVRPKLPDRNELQDDAALARAAETLLDALIERVLAELRELTRAWPSRIENLYHLAPSVTTWQGDMDVLKTALPILGWREVQYTDLEGVYVFDGSDGVEIESPDVVRYDRDARVVASDALNLTLNTLGYATARLSGVTDPRVSVTGLRVSDDSPHIALAERIEVAGVGELPYLSTENEFDLEGLGDVGAAIIFAGSCADFVATLRDSDALALAIFLHSADHYEWIEYAGGESQIDLTELRDEITLQVTRAFVPTLLVARERYYAVEALREPTSEAAAAVEDVLRMFGELAPDESVREHIAALEECREIFGALRAAVDERVRELATAAQL